MAISICSTVGANTGEIDCDVTRGVPVQLVLGSAEFEPADYATQDLFQAAFEEKLKLPAGSTDKLFPFPVIQGNTDQTEAAKYGNLGYGLKVKLLRSKAAYEFDVLAGSSLEKKLIKFDGKMIPIFIFDDQSNIWGVKESSGNFKGAKYLIGVEPRGFGDANNPKTTKITISIIDSRDFTENARFASTTFSTTDIVGLVDVNLEELSNIDNVYKIGVTIETSELNNTINLYGNYSAELADASLWVAKTGLLYDTPLTITSVAADAVLKAWTVTFDAVAYAALNPSDKIKLSLADPATLDAADVVGVESDFIIITVA